MGQRSCILECGGAICDVLVVHIIRLDLKIARNNCHTFWGSNSIVESIKDLQDYMLPIVKVSSKQVQFAFVG